MNSNTSFVQSWLNENENTISCVEDILLNTGDWADAGDLRGAASTPPIRGGLILTNRRLIVVFYNNTPKLPPMWYSVASIAGLRERPPGYVAGWPYQARLTFYSGAQLVCETLKDKPEERGKELSRFLVQALMSLDSAPKVGSQVAEYIEEEKRRNASQQSQISQRAKDSPD